MSKLKWKRMSGALSGAATFCCEMAPDAQLNWIKIYDNNDNKKV
jgi:hypothetical protein